MFGLPSLFSFVFRGRSECSRSISLSCTCFLKMFSVLRGWRHVFRRFPLCFLLLELSSRPWSARARFRFFWNLLRPFREHLWSVVASHPAVGDFAFSGSSPGLVRFMRGRKLLWSFSPSLGFRRCGPVEFGPFPGTRRLLLALPLLFLAFSARLSAVDPFEQCWRLMLAFSIYGHLCRTQPRWGVP